MWRRAVTAALALGTGAGAAAIATSDDPAKTLKICTHLPPRLFRDSVAAATIAFDYQYSLLGLEPESEAWKKAKHETHLRSANRLQEICFRNGGIYIKLGQHMAQLEYVLPVEYVQTMRASMLKRCPVSSLEEVHRVFKKDVGELPEKVFAEFDPVPIASASLAQVHAATTHDDIATVDLVVNAVHYIFPTFDYRWLVDEIRESAPKELDFLCEAQNSERCLINFRKLSPHIENSIYIPKVYWNLSSSRILTMEYMDAKEVVDGRRRPGRELARRLRDPTSGVISYGAGSLPIYDDAGSSARIANEMPKAFAILEDIVQHTLSNLHSIEKSLLYWKPKAEGSNSHKMYFMIFERGPRAFVEATRETLTILRSNGSPSKYLVNSASDMVSTKIAVLTSMQNRLAAFLAEVYSEVDNCRGGLTESLDKSLSTLFVLLNTIFSKLEAMFHPGAIKR